MTQKLKKAAIFACNYVISPHRIKCNNCIESFMKGFISSSYTDELWAIYEDIMT